MKTILCIGAGYVGGPTMAVIAKHCPEYRIIVADIDEKKIRAWQGDNLPIYEPGLDTLVRETLDRNLFFSSDITGGIQEADIIFVSVNTPTKTFGRGAGKAADLVIFDPATVADRSTWQEPRCPPVGVDWVMVNGEWIIQEGVPTGNRPGRVLHRSS